MSDLKELLESRVSYGTPIQAARYIGKEEVGIKFILEQQELMLPASNGAPASAVVFDFRNLDSAEKTALISLIDQTLESPDIIVKSGDQVKFSPIVADVSRSLRSTDICAVFGEDAAKIKNDCTKEGADLLPLAAIEAAANYKPNSGPSQTIAKATVIATAAAFATGYSVAN